jgi:hypothetical protein
MVKDGQVLVIFIVAMSIPGVLSIITSEEIISLYEFDALTDKALLKLIVLLP